MGKQPEITFAPRRLGGSDGKKRQNIEESFKAMANRRGHVRSSALDRVAVSADLVPVASVFSHLGARILPFRIDALFLYTFDTPK